MRKLTSKLYESQIKQNYILYKSKLVVLIMLNAIELDNVNNDIYERNNNLVIIPYRIINKRF